MKTLIISDIHANLVALETVFRQAGEYDTVWCLGDLVGYGPNPNECIERIRTCPNLVCILGNHDAAALNQIDVNAFNADARRAVLWTQRELTAESMQFLASLPEISIQGNITLAHGSPRKPIWEYILDVYTATANFKVIDTPFCFVGHSHLPVQYILQDGKMIAKMVVPDPNTDWELQPRSILNPGSVGQPRDRDPRASFALLDTETMMWEYRRVTYDISATQALMKAVKLPERHIVRLKSGW